VIGKCRSEIRVAWPSAMLFMLMSDINIALLPCGANHELAHLLEVFLGVPGALLPVLTLCL